MTACRRSVRFVVGSGRSSVPNWVSFGPKAEVRCVEAGPGSIDENCVGPGCWTRDDTDAARGLRCDQLGYSADVRRSAALGMAAMTGERVVRRLAAILAADVVGYSRLMGRDEHGTLARLKAHRTERLEPTLARHGGRLVKLTGDGALVEFPSAVDALSAAIDSSRP